MKRILGFGVVTLLLCVISLAWAQRITYFAEDFNVGQDGDHTIRTYWDTAASQSILPYLRLSGMSYTGCEKPEAIIGYYPELGLKDVLNGEFLLVSKPFETKGGNTYVTLKYAYEANKKSLPANRDIRILARQGNGEWTTCALIDSLPMKIPASVLCVRLPEMYEEATAMQIAVQLKSTRDGCQFAFSFDDLTCFSIPADWYAAEMNLLSSGNVSGDLDTLDMEATNTGNEMQATYTISYRWDGGEIHTKTDSLDKPVVTDAAFAVRFKPNGWDSVAYGEHVLEIWVSEIDGKAVKEEALQKQTYLFCNVKETDLFAKKILIEEFTSATCPPCASWNQMVFNPTFEELGMEVTLIKYQMDWPGAGDKYYRREGGARKSYYGVTGAPTMVVEGEVISPASEASQFLAYLRERMAAAGKAFFNIEFTTLKADSTTKLLQINYKLVSKGNLPNVKLQTVVLERETTGNKGSNGESSFHHVMMAMTPGIGADGNTGLTMNLKADSVYEFNYTVNLKNSYVEEYHDLLVACFIQAEDGTVLQSAIQEVLCGAVNAGNESALAYEPLVIYPNPASEKICLPGLTHADLEVYDMAGRRQCTVDGISGDYWLDIRAYIPGMYILKVREKGKVSVARLSVVR